MWRKSLFVLFVLFVFLTACSITPKIQTEDGGTQNANNGSAPEPSAKVPGDAYLLVANFHWVDPHTNTDIMYSYSVPFTVKPNGDLASFGDLEGAAIGQAGLNNDGCVEARAFSMTWDFEMLGQKTKVTMDQVDPGLLLSAPDLVESDQMTVFVFTLATPQVTSFELEPFSTCFAGLDEEVAKPLLKFWLDVIPTLPTEYHLVPADTGTFCTEPISFIEDGLGELTPCYSISQP